MPSEVIRHDTRKSAAAVWAVTFLSAISLGNCLLAWGVVRAGEKVEAAGAKSLESGRPAGARVPSFYVRAVTGPLSNKSVCYVCRNGDRPVVMVLMRQIEPAYTKLLKGIDRLVDGNRARGLRSFGVLIADQPSQAAPKLQTLSFDEEIDMPLTVGTGVVATQACQNVHPEAALTVVLYHELRVVKRFAFRQDALTDDDVAQVLDGIEDLVEGE